MALPLRFFLVLAIVTVLFAGAPAWAQDSAASRAPGIAKPTARLAARSSVAVDDEWADEQKPRTMPPATYRTICVRMCDGYYFPISFLTTRQGLDTDASRCTAKCGPGAQLFFHANPGGDVASARSFTGMQYESLPNAFLHLKQRVPGCGCSPDAVSAVDVRRQRSAEPTESAAVSRSGGVGQERPLALLRRAAPAKMAAPLDPHSTGRNLAPSPAVAPEPILQDRLLAPAASAAPSVHVGQRPRARGAVQN